MPTELINSSIGGTATELNNLFYYYYFIIFYVFLLFCTNEPYSQLSLDVLFEETVSQICPGWLLSYSIAQASLVFMINLPSIP